MPLSAAERMRKYRERMRADPDKHKEYLEKEKKRYRERREAGKLTTIHSLENERDKRLLRRKWRLARRKERANQKERMQVVQSQLSPPASPEYENQHGLFAQDPSPRSVEGHKRLRRDRTRSYKRIKELEKEIAEKTRLIEKYRKQSYRLRVSMKDTNSPRTKTKEMLKGQKVTGNVRKTLLFHHTLTETMKSSYSSLKSDAMRKSVASVIKGKLMKKYRLMKMANVALGISKDMLYSDNSVKHHKSSRFSLAKKAIRSFFTRDDVSRVKAGKKECVTRNKLKKQKRLLTDSLKNTHLKFLAEYSGRVSYSLFCRLRPFWVLLPTLADRETCQCKLHSNAQLMADRLFQSNVLPARDLEELIEQTHCVSSQKSCMYGQCGVCVNKQFPAQTHDPGQQTWWFQWKNILDERTELDGSRQTFKKIAKLKQIGTLDQLRKEFQDQRPRLSKHLYNIRHQYKLLKVLRDDLPENSAVIHIDFSENYACKYREEIQSFHFGGSREQVTLHTGVAYVHGSIESFTTLSSSRRHDPAAIWAHLKPVLLYLKERYPQLDTYHFVSDGPTTQYRCRKNFFLFSTEIFKFGAVYATWNFLEAGHGKGPADGIGSVIKRTADKLVSQGSEITDAKSMFAAVSPSVNVKLWFVSSETINEFERKFPDSVPPVPGTMTIHQLFTDSPGELRCRDVSCFCKTARPCNCYDPWKCVLQQNRTPVPSSGEEIAVATEPDPILNEIHPDNLSESLIGKWCVIKYDGLPYPGIVQDVDDGELEVKVMHKIGVNRYFWPAMDDVLWYTVDNLVTMMPPTEPVTGRHQQIQPAIWKAIIQLLDL